MSSRETKIACLKRLFEKTHCQDEFLEYLHDQQILHKDYFMANDHERDVLKAIDTALRAAVEKDKVLLLDFKWQLLPLEQIKLTIITSKGSRDWLYGY